MALITTSGSMPFSFANASMVCCNGFDMLKVHFKVRARNHADRHAVLAAVVCVYHHRVVLDAAQPPSEEGVAVHRLAHHELRAPARKGPIVVGVPERPGEARRGRLQWV